jgi:hypothetical protein
MLAMLANTELCRQIIIVPAWLNISFLPFCRYSYFFSVQGHTGVNRATSKTINEWDYIQQTDTNRVEWGNMKRKKFKQYF